MKPGFSENLVPGGWWEKSDRFPVIAVVLGVAFSQKHPRVEAIVVLTCVEDAGFWCLTRL